MDTRNVQKKICKAQDTPTGSENTAEQISEEESNTTSNGPIDDHDDSALENGPRSRQLRLRNAHDEERERCETVRDNEDSVEIAGLVFVAHCVEDEEAGEGHEAKACESCEAHKALLQGSPPVCIFGRDNALHHEVVLKGQVLILEEHGHHCQCVLVAATLVNVQLARLLHFAVCIVVEVRLGLLLQT